MALMVDLQKSKILFVIGWGSDYICSPYENFNRQSTPGSKR